MAKQFMRGVIPGGMEFINIFCFDEDTADAIDDFVELNSDPRGTITLPTGDSREILMAFFARVKDQVSFIFRLRKRTLNNTEIHALGFNGWAYNVCIAWNDNLDREIGEGNPKALLLFCQTLSAECEKLDELKERFAVTKKDELKVE